MSSWYEKNKEKHKANRRLYYIKNKDRQKSTSKAWRESNPDAQRAYSKKYYENNKNKYLEKRPQYWATTYKNNSEKIKKYRKEYYENNKHRYRANCAKRKAAKLQQTPKWADLKAIAEFYKNCPEGYHVDHIIPLQGKNVRGLHTLENLQYLPAVENQKKYNKIVK